MKLLLSGKKLEKLCAKYLGWDIPVSDRDLGLARKILEAQLKHIFNLDMKTTTEVIVKLQAHLDKLFLKEMAK